MAKTLLTKSFEILFKLEGGKATLDGLVEHTRCPLGMLSSPLRILEEQGLIRRNGGFYELSLNAERSKALLNLVRPWISYQDHSYREIAKDVARIIHTKSRHRVGVKDVILFGSTLREDKNPDDIDLLILHYGVRLDEFSKDPYRKFVSIAAESDQPFGKENKRCYSSQTFNLLGFVGDGTDKDYTDAEFEDYRKDSAYQHIKKRVRDLIGETDDVEGINQIFDVHSMRIDLFIRDEANATRRDQAMSCCRDRSFWHTVLTEGRIFDLKKHDFLIRVNDKYPGATDLFKQ